MAELRGTPAAIHARDADLSQRRVVVCQPTASAVVLGSAQGAGTIDEDAARRRGLAVVRRRSGGGAVVVEPGRMLWIEVVVPAGDPVWEDDLGRSFLWLGRAWAAALKACGVTGAKVHTGAMRRTRWSPVLCFAGVGPGEVHVGGHKVVGLSQRRRREGAVYQCAVLLAWDPALHAALVRVEAPSEVDELVEALTAGAAPVPLGEAPLTASLLSALASVAP